MLYELSFIDDGVIELTELPGLLNKDEILSGYKGG